MRHHPLAALGYLTIVSYGAWFYGFGVLLDDIVGTTPRLDRDRALFTTGVAGLIHPLALASSCCMGVASRSARFPGTPAGHRP